MKIIEIKALENGSHRNQTIDSLKIIPEGWAVIPDDMETPYFPFGEITTKEIDGVVTVTSWTPGTMPEPETPVIESENDELTTDDLAVAILEGVNAV